MKHSPMPMTARLFSHLRGLPSCSVLVVFGLLFLAPIVRALEEGESAPEFELTGSDGGSYTLSKLREEHAGIVLAFFPRAFTPG